LRPSLPVILMSGYGATQLAERDIVSPCGILGKPFHADVLLAEVRRCIRGQLT
jgi:DNA-binding NtrC family response regulator